MDLKICILTIICLLPCANCGVIPACYAPKFAEAAYDGSDKPFKPGTNLTLRCKENYEEGSPTVKCVNETWTHPNPPCKLVACPSLGDQAPGVKQSRLCHRYNCSIDFECPVGYWYTGRSPIICQRDSTWSDTVSTCEAVLCPELRPKNGIVIQPDRSYNKTATTVCDEGFIINDQRYATRRCQENNTWDGKEAVCNAVRCSKLADPPNGQVFHPNRTYNAEAITVCNRGYIPTNPESTVRRCQGNNTWSGKNINCTRKPCEDVNMVDNGILSAQGGKFGDKITLQCNSGYRLDGIATVTCQPSGKWDSEIGKCNNNKDPHLIAISIVAVLAVIGILFIFLVRHYWKKRQTQNLEHQAEQIPLTGGMKKNVKTFTFILRGDLESAYLDESSEEYDKFLLSIRKSIQKATQKLNVSSVDVSYLCKTSKRGFGSVTSTSDENDLMTAMKHSNIRKKTFEIVSVSMSDNVKCALSEAILRKKHVRDKEMDDKVDFTSQYVKLKLQRDPTMGLMQPQDIERQDYHEKSGCENGEDIEDEDLIRHNDYGKYVLIRGRAGIGKSTLLQRLLSRWANGEWATHITAIFLLNLRYIMTIQDVVDFSFMLNMYSEYKTGKSEFTVSKDWLKENETNIVFVLDGVDEVDFTAFKKKYVESQGTRTPLQWCFAVMKREWLKTSTVIVSSRPFVQLRTVEQMVKQISYKDLMLVQLIGLTLERIEEFIKKNVKEDSKDFVRDTLMTDNPILKSLSSITFYCSTLCKLLGELKENPVGLVTYTQITAYIMANFIKRSMKKVEPSLQKREILTDLANLAYHGLARVIGERALPLSFGAEDINEVGVKKEIINLMIKWGLLMQTETPDEDGNGNCSVITQFVHLLIQEFLAMAGLLSTSKEEFQSILDKLGETQQFGMAITFLYGLAFDSNNDYIRQLYTANCSGKEKEWEEKKQILLSFTEKLPELKAALVAHESQSEDVKLAVGQHHFKNGCCFKNGKLILIDIMAVTSVIECNYSIKKLSLERVHLDIVSLQEISKFLKCTDTGVEEVVLSTNSMDDHGLLLIADALKANKTLKTLELSSSEVTDEGLRNIAEALKENTTLEVLRLHSRQFTDKGVEYLMGKTTSRTHVREICVSGFHMTDAAVNAVMRARSTAPKLSIRMWEPHVGEDLRTQISADSKITIEA